MTGEEIKKIRKSLNLTQEEFAHQLGVTLSTVNRWETKKTRASRLAKREIMRLAKENGIIKE